MEDELQAYEKNLREYIMNRLAQMETELTADDVTQIIRLGFEYLKENGYIE